MEEMVAPFLPFFIFVSYLCKSIDDYNPLKRKVNMKRMMLLLAFCGLLTTAMADWTSQLRITSIGGTVQIQTLR